MRLLPSVEAAVQKMNRELTVVFVRTESELPAAFERMNQQKAGALYAAADSIINALAKQTGSLALQRKMACVFSSGASADFGIVTYGPDFAALGRTAAAIALRIFKGTKPADIPFEQAMHFEIPSTLAMRRQWVSLSLGQSLCALVGSSNDHAQRPRLNAWNRQVGAVHASDARVGLHRQGTYRLPLPLLSGDGFASYFAANCSRCSQAIAMLVGWMGQGDMTRRRSSATLTLIVVWSVLTLWGDALRGQNYPARPLRRLVSGAAGGVPDAVARIVAQGLSQELGQPIVIENRVGAAGTIAMEAGAKALAEGYTIVLGTTGTLASAAALYPNLPYDPIKSFSPVSQLVTAPYVVAVHPSIASTLKDFIDRAKAKPGQLNFGSRGNGGPPHVAGEMFKTVAGVQLAHVPYKAMTNAVTDLVAGRVQVMFNQLTIVQAHVQSEKLNVLCIAGPKASCATARCADHRRARPAGLRCLDLVRSDRVAWRPAGHHHEAKYRSVESLGDQGGARWTGRTRLRARRRHARAIRRTDSSGAGQVATRDQGVGR